MSATGSWELPGEESLGFVLSWWGTFLGLSGAGIPVLVRLGPGLGLSLSIVLVLFVFVVSGSVSRWLCGLLGVPLHGQLRLENSALSWPHTRFSKNEQFLLDDSTWVRKCALQPNDERPGGLLIEIERNGISLWIRSSWSSQAEALPAPTASPERVLQVTVASPEKLEELLGVLQTFTKQTPFRQ